MKKDRKAVRLKKKGVKFSTFIHYGSSYFDPTIVENSKDHSTCLNKPSFGLWASPVDSDWGWKDWCESEEFYKSDFSKYFVFKLKSNAKMLTIRSLKDWDKILNEVLKDSFNTSKDIFVTIDSDQRNKIWEYICKKYDAILVIMSDHYGTMHMSFEFNAWDCDSIVVFNPEVVNIVRHSA